MSNHSRKGQNIFFYIEIALKGGAEGQLIAAKYFTEISLQSDKREKIILDGALDVLVSLTRSDDIDVQRESVRALASFVQSPLVSKHIADKGGLRGLSSLMQSYDKMVQCLAARCVGFIASRDVTVGKVVKDGALLPLIQLLKLDHKETQRDAALALARFSFHDEVAVRMLHVWSIPPLLGLLQSDDYDVLRAVSIAIGHLAFNPGMAAAFVQSKALELLFPLTLSESADVRKESLSAYLQFAAHHESLRGLFFSPCNALLETVLMKMHQEDDFDVRRQMETILDVLSMAAHEDSMLQVLLKFACLDLLVSIFKGKNCLRIQRVALAAIVQGAWLTVSTPSTIISSGLIASLMPLLRGINASEVRPKALQVLHMLCKIDNLRLAIGRLEAIPLLISLLSFKDEPTRLWSSMCLAELSEKEENQNALLKENGLNPLVNYLNSKDKNYQRQAVRIISNLCSDVNVKDKFINRGGLRRLVALLAYDDVEFQRSCLKGINNFATTSDFRVKCLHENVLPHLQEKCLSLDPEVAILSVKLLCSFYEDEHTVNAYSKDMKQHPSIISLQLSAAIISSLYRRETVPQLSRIALRLIASTCGDEQHRHSWLQDKGINTLLHCYVKSSSNPQHEDIKSAASIALLQLSLVAPIAFAAAMKESDSFKQISIADFQNVLRSNMDRSMEVFLKENQSSSSGQKKDKSGGGGAASKDEVLEFRPYMGDTLLRPSFALAQYVSTGIHPATIRIQTKEQSAANRLMTSASGSAASSMPSSARGMSMTGGGGGGAPQQQEEKQVQVNQQIRTSLSSASASKRASKFRSSILSASSTFMGGVSDDDDSDSENKKNGKDEDNKKENEKNGAGAEDGKDGAAASGAAPGPATASGFILGKEEEEKPQWALDDDAIEAILAEERQQRRQAKEREMEFIARNSKPLAHRRSASAAAGGAGLSLSGRLSSASRQSTSRMAAALAVARESIEAGKEVDVDAFEMATASSSFVAEKKRVQSANAAARSRPSSRLSIKMPSSPSSPSNSRLVVASPSASTSPSSLLSRPLHQFEEVAPGRFRMVDNNGHGNTKKKSSPASAARGRPRSRNNVNDDKENVGESKKQSAPAAAKPPRSASASSGHGKKQKKGHIPGLPPHRPLSATGLRSFTRQLLEADGLALPDIAMDAHQDVSAQVSSLMAASAKIPSHSSAVIPTAHLLQNDDGAEQQDLNASFDENALANLTPIASLREIGGPLAAQF